MSTVQRCTWRVHLIFETPGCYRPRSYRWAGPVDTAAEAWADAVQALRTDARLKGWGTPTVLSCGAIQPVPTKKGGRAA